MRARLLQRPNRGEGPCVFSEVNKRSLRATRPLKTARDSLTPFEMTFRNGFESKGEIKLYYRQFFAVASQIIAHPPGNELQTRRS
jgi:hypothetical protein